MVAQTVSHPLYMEEQAMHLCIHYAIPIFTKSRSHISPGDAAFICKVGGRKEQWKAQIELGRVFRACGAPSLFASKNRQQDSQQRLLSNYIILCLHSGKI